MCGPGTRRRSELSEALENGRRPRLEDVAAAVGLSTASVSLVLRNAPGPSAQTRQRVLDAAAQLGYRPDRAASLLARRRSRLIGVLMDVRSTFHAAMVEDIHEAAEQHGYDLVLSTVTRSRDEQRAVETLVDSRCEALVLLGPVAPARRLAELDRQLPVVAVGRRIPSAAVDVVRVADDEGVGQVVAYLAGLGHRNITYVDGGRDSIATDRRRGYERAMRRAGLGGSARVIPGDHTEDAGSRAARALLTGGELPTAVVTFNDHSAVGLLDVLSREGVDVPAAVSVAGYDNSPLSRLAHINLTTVSQDTRLLTEHAVAAVVERLDGGRTTHREVVLPPHLVVRDTTGPPRR
jgi:DNA-binding LacI/PurR family transcriptional regulator